MSERCPFRLVCLGVLLTVCGFQKVLGHPTNGYFCTDIETPTACFNSDGFCEWVRGQCLYRCDIHDGFEDCGQIKVGCRWNGEFCVPIPLPTDQGLDPLDASLQDAVVRPDGMQSDAVEAPDPWRRDAMMADQSIDAVPETMEIIEATSPSGCRIDRRQSFEALLWSLIPLVWRRRPC